VVEAAILPLVKVLYTQCTSDLQVALSAAVAVTNCRGLASYSNLAATSILDAVTVLSENGNHNYVF
jgi:hypothetical protein